MPSPQNHSTMTLTVAHSPTLTRAEDWKRWLLLPSFERKRRQLGLDDDDLAALQIGVMCDPKGSPVMKGTGGLRKFRFSKIRSGKGKSGSYRVGYAYFEEYGVIAAIAIYAKSDQADIPAAQRKQIKELIAKLDKWLADGG
jgi:hypothetical protein